jgi:hypothetical protein
MSAIFEAEFHDLDYVKDNESRKAKASTAKLVLLAIADHANDCGESAYPGFTHLELKTALSRQGISDTIEALKYNGLLTVDEKPSRLHTNSYTINVRSLPAIARELPDIVKSLEQQESSSLTIGSQATLPEVVKPLDLNHPLTTIQPPNNQNKKDMVDGLLEIGQMPGAKKQLVKEYIFEEIKRKLGMNPSGKDAESFINYAASEHKKGHDFARFLSWWIENNPDPTFWSFRRMEQMHPRAFIESAKTEYNPIGLVIGL